MTQRTPSFLKALFENGDVPQATDYEDVFDSYLNIETSAAQTMSGNLTVPNIRVSGAVTADSVNVSAGVVCGSVTTGIVSATSLTLSDRLYLSYAGINAAGTTQSTATIVSADVVAITVSDTARGVKLPFRAGCVQQLHNLTASTTAASVFPASGANFVGTAANAHMLLAAGQTLTVIHVGASAYAFNRF